MAELADIDFKTLTPPSSPNTYLVCPQNACASLPDRLSPIFKVHWRELAKHWEIVVNNKSRVTRLDDTDDYQYNYVQRTFLFRFPDYITVRFYDLSEDKSTLAIYSRSKYGYSDFGVNENRVTSWLDELLAHVDDATTKESQ